MPPGLTQLYDRIFQQVVSVNFEEMIPYALDILPAVCLVFRPITRRELAVLSGLPSETRDHPDQVEEYLELCGSFLALRKKPHSQSAILSQGRLRTEDEMRVFLVHQSAKDYLLKSRKDDSFS
jgi:hypothetical protein